MHILSDRLATAVVVVSFGPWPINTYICQTSHTRVVVWPIGRMQFAMLMVNALPTLTTFIYPNVRTARSVCAQTVREIGNLLVVLCSQHECCCIVKLRDRIEDQDDDVDNDDYCHLCIIIVGSRSLAMLCRCDKVKVFRHNRARGGIRTKSTNSHTHMV